MIERGPAVMKTAGLVFLLTQKHGLLRGGSQKGAVGGPGFGPAVQHPFPNVQIASPNDNPRWGGWKVVPVGGEIKRDAPREGGNSAIGSDKDAHIQQRDE